MDVALGPITARQHKLLTDLLRRDYLDPEVAKIVITDACVTAGHPPKIEKPYEMKRDWQRGCVCGRQAFI